MMQAKGLASVLPITGWLPHYKRDWLTPDLLAGLAIWAVMVPEGMAYAGIVGVPPIMGLYTLVPPLFAYALFGTSKRLVIGPDTATGVISALTVGAVVAHGTAEFATLTSTLALLIGLLFLLFGLLRTGWIAAFVATPVMRGFIEGLVCVTIIGQVGSLLGLHGASGNFIAKLLFILGHFGEISVPAAIIGILSLASMLLLRRFAPKVPAALVVAAVATIAMGLSGQIPGVELVGKLPTGLPQFKIPTLDLAVIEQLMPGALSIVLVGYAEALGAAKAASAGEHVDPNQELVAHGFANVSSAVFGGFLVVGSLSKTSVAMSAGSRTQVANAFGGLLCLATLVFLTPLFRTLPHPALAAIVIAAMLHLSKPAYLRKLAKQAPIEFWVAMTVIAGELVLGVLQGIALGVVISLLMLIYRTSHPMSAVLGKLPDEDAYRDIRLHPEAKVFPGLLIWNPGGPLFFANADRFETDLKAAIAQNPTPVKQVLIDASSVTFIDSSARDVFARLIPSLRRREIGMSFARLRDPVLFTLEREGIVDAIGRSSFYDRLTDGVRAFLDSSGDRTSPA
jgi:high affinity sulfate transporter 1